MSALSTEQATKDSSQDHSFPKRVRLRARRQFLRAQREGARYSSRSFFAHVRHSGRGPVKLGITASKKVGKAHDRNRYKRLTREAFRLSSLRAQSGYELVIVIKQESPPARLTELITELEALAERLRSGQFTSAAHKKKKQGRRAHGHKRSTSTPSAPRHAEGALQGAPVTGDSPIGAR